MKDEQPSMLPCPFCGSVDIVMWDGVGTQADLECNDCGCGRHVQVIDLFEGPAKDRPLLDAQACYPDDLVEIAKRHLRDEWNMRADQWQPISTAPRDGTRILTFGLKEGQPRQCITWWRRGQDAKGYIGWGEWHPELWPPTHWMPLPALPQPAAP